ncbi:MAG: hypothetical protein HY718_17420, partial [Planctomycetes bacterium]|nr:hypothetical protein [Planctomycetota bacterium]
VSAGANTILVADFFDDTTFGVTFKGNSSTASADDIVYVISGYAR